MNKKNTRKGFTIVELVIVIAVIAILATVLVPTFGDVISKAQTASLKQEAKALHTNYVMAHTDAGESYVTNCWVKVDDSYVEMVNGGVTDNIVAEANLPANVCYNKLVDGEIVPVVATNCTNGDNCFNKANHPTTPTGGESTGDQTTGG